MLYWYSMKPDKATIDTVAARVRVSKPIPKSEPAHQSTWQWLNSSRPDRAGR